MLSRRLLPTYKMIVIFNFYRRIQAVTTLGNDEVKNLNKAVGRLFDHLRIQKLSEIARESTGIPVTHGRSPTTIGKKGDDFDDFKEIIRKVRGLENELLRQKASQTTELKRSVIKVTRIPYYVTNICYDLRAL